MNWILFNDNADDSGIEGRLCFKDSTLYIDVNPTSWRKPYIKWVQRLFKINLSVDWLINLKFWPGIFDRLDWKRGVIHAGYKRYSIWLSGYIIGLIVDNPEIKKVRLSGYSMGAGIIQGTAKDLERIIPTECLCIDNIVTTLPQPKNMTMYYKRGGLYCLLRWLIRAKNEVCIDKKWRPIWISHRWTQEEIDDTITAG